MKCHLCCREKKLIKAHVIPEKFFTPLRSEKKSPVLCSNIDGKYPKRSPIGIYDSTILCSKCDNYIGVWDNYAKQLLLKEFDESLAVYQGTEKVMYKINSFDYEKLKLFFISVLWRAAISNHVFFKRIKLDPYQDEIKEMVLNGDPGAPEKYPVVIAKFRDPNMTAILDPHKDKFDGINFYRFYMTGFVIYIKVDKRETPEFLKDFYIREKQPICILLRDLHNSKDGKIMIDIAKKNLK